MKSNTFGPIKVSVFTGLVLSSPFLLAQQEVSACLSIQSDTRRLQCYDRNLGFIKTSPEYIGTTSDPLPETAGKNSESVTTTPVITENSNVDVLAREKEQDRIEASDDVARIVIAASKDRFRGWQIEFENGEKWQQIGSDYFSIEVGESYIIVPGSFDSYFLTNTNGRSRIRVTQVQ